MKALKFALLALGLFSLVSLKADTWNMGVSATANTGGSGARNPAQLLAIDPSTNAIRMLACDANGNLLIANGLSVTWSTSVGTTLTAINGAAATSYFDKLTATANATTYFNMNPVTYASSVVGTSAQYLTLTTKSCLSIDNTTSGTLFFVLTNSSTAPTNTATVRLSLATSQAWCKCLTLGQLSAGYNWLHWVNANAATPTAELTY